jgi:hypothetical protein
MQVPSAPIRVLVDVDGLLAGVVTSMLQSQPDVTLLRRPAQVDRIERYRDIDVVITTLEGRPKADERREPPTIAISATGTHAEIVDRWTVREVGLDKLVAAVREVARHRDGRTPHSTESTT